MLRLLVLLNTGMNRPHPQPFSLDAVGELLVHIFWFPGSACGTAVGGSASKQSGASVEAEPLIGQKPTPKDAEHYHNVPL